MKRILSVIAMLCVAASQAAAVNKPKVVIFLADNSGWGDYSFTGNTI
jgi:hypothetical protein